MPKRGHAIAHAHPMAWPGIPRAGIDIKAKKRTSISLI